MLKMVMACVVVLVLLVSTGTVVHAAPAAHLSIDCIEAIPDQIYTLPVRVDVEQTELSTFHIQINWAEGQGHYTIDEVFHTDLVNVTVQQRFGQVEVEAEMGQVLVGEAILFELRGRITGVPGNSSSLGIDFLDMRDANGEVIPTGDRIGCSITIVSIEDVPSATVWVMVLLAAALAGGLVWQRNRVGA